MTGSGGPAATRLDQRRSKAARLARGGRSGWCGLARAAAALWIALGAGRAGAVAIDVQALPGATGLSSPLAIVDAGDGSGRLFIVEQGGQIRIWKNGALLATPFLTIPAAKIACCGERGLLGLAFHPDFEG